jgi:hypothetical protein
MGENWIDAKNKKTTHLCLLFFTQCREITKHARINIGMCNIDEGRLNQVGGPKQSS